jgi:hypothetical protein
MYFMKFQPQLKFYSLAVAVVVLKRRLGSLLASNFKFEMKMALKSM